MNSSSPQDRRRGSSKRKSAAPAKVVSQLRVARVGPGDVWELVHPRCAQEREEDLAEVREMLDAGERELAVEELRWLLEDCRELLEAHRLLGEVARDNGDWKLARAHFGYVYQTVLTAVAATPDCRALPYERDANQVLYESTRRLIECLRALGESQRADEVVAQALAWDPSNTAGINRPEDTPPCGGLVILE